MFEAVCMLDPIQPVEHHIWCAACPAPLHRYISSGMPEAGFRSSCQKIGVCVYAYIHMCIYLIVRIAETVSPT